MHRKIFGPFVIMVVAVFALTGAACNRVQQANPVAAACKDLGDNLALCGYATYGTFTVFEELGAKVAKDVGPGETRDAIIRADEIAKPVADSLDDALALYETVRVEVAAGREPQERLAIATANLNRWITEAAPLVANLVKAVNEAKGAKK